MTLEEKIELLETEKAYMLSHGGDSQAEALTSAIEALKAGSYEDEWIPVEDPFNELPKDGVLWVTRKWQIDGDWFDYDVDTVYWDMTEWSDRVDNVVAYMPYKEPEPYKKEGK